jgi:molybdopterin converting factor subunit 1
MSHSQTTSSQHGLKALATVRVLLFAAIRDKAGVESLELPASTVADVSRQLGARFPATKPLLERSRFAVNQSFSSPDTPLRKGDEVAVIPPVSGG